MLLPAPWPNMKPTACNIAIMPKTTPVAPEALVLICPTNQVSTTLYRLVMSMLTVVGMPSSRMREDALAGHLIVLAGIGGGHGRDLFPQTHQYL